MMKKLMIILFVTLMSIVPAYAGMNSFLDVDVKCVLKSINLATFTETDDESQIDSVTPAQVTWTDMEQDYTEIVYRDYGANYFNGDFSFRFTCQYANIDNWGITAFFVLNKNLESGGVTTNTTEETDDLVSFRIYDNDGTEELKLHVYEDGVSTAADTWASPSPSTDYYITITRDYDGGANSTGQYKVYIRTGSHSGTLQDTLSVDSIVGEQNDFQYLFVLDGWEKAIGSRESDGYTKDWSWGACLIE